MEQNKIYVGYLSSETTQSTLEKVFSAYGSISEINLIRDKYTGESKGFAFIKFSSTLSASKALEMNGKTIDEKTVSVSPAKKKQSFSGSRRQW